MHGSWSPPVTNPNRPADQPGPPDMSSEGIDRRLREVAQLHELGVSLLQARWVGPLEVRDKRQPDSPGE